MSARSEPTQSLYLERLRARVESLPNGLQAHIYRVRDVAFGLADRHGIDQERAEAGTLAHDVGRAWGRKLLLSMADDYDIIPASVERRSPGMLHGPVGAESLRRDDGIEDDELLDAVRWHTTGHPTLGPLGKLVFLADKLEPRKIKDYPYQPELQKIAEEDLGQAVLEFLSRESAARLQRRQPVHPLSLETINTLIMEAEGPTG